MVKKFPYSRQQILRQDISAVNKVLKSNYLTQGPVVKEFEKKISKKVNVKYAVAVNSATSALHIACLALDLSPGDWLWTSPNTFVASANCGRYCGADIDFVDMTGAYTFENNAVITNCCGEKLNKNFAYPSHFLCHIALVARALKIPIIKGFLYNVF